jgi:putative lipoprotein
MSVTTVSLRCGTRARFVFLLALVAASFCVAQTNQPVITGSITYRERIALPSDAAIDVQLVDTSVADVASQTVAESMLNAEGRQVPIPFTLNYDPAQIVPAHHYSVRATIRSADGMLLFSTTQAYPVLTHGAPSKVILVLHTVGHGGKPGAITSKKPAPNSRASEAPTPSTSDGAMATEPGSAQPPASPGTSTSDNVVPTPSLAAASASAVAESASGQQSPATAIPKSDNVGETTVAPATAKPDNVGEGRSPSASASVPALRAEEATKAPEPEATPSAQPVANSSQPAVTVQPGPLAQPEVTPPSQEPMPQPDAPQVTPQRIPQPDVAPAPPQPKVGQAETQPQPLGAQPSPSELPAREQESEATLPEAPSASKRAEGTMPALEAEGNTAESASESTSRPERPLPNKALTRLADTQWRLVELGGVEIVTTPPDRPLTLAFSPEGARIAGSAGCNSYRGTFSDYVGLLHLNPIAITMVGCSDAGAERQQKFVSMMRSADGYKIEDEMLVLTSSGKTVAKFRNIGE